MRKAERHCEDQLKNKSCSPYESELVFAENAENMAINAFVNSVIGVLKTATQLQLTIETAQENKEEQKQNVSKEILEIVHPVPQDYLICKFAALVGLEKNQKSILEMILDLVIDFWRLCEKFPWILKSRNEETMSDI